MKIEDFFIFNDQIYIITEFLEKTVLEEIKRGLGKKIENSLQLI